MTAPSTPSAATPGAAVEPTPTPSKKYLLPRDFERAVQHIVDTQTGDAAHRALDQLVTEQLTGLGYGKGMTIFLEAVAARHALAQSPAPVGWKTVPVEPTEEMLRNCESAVAAYKAEKMRDPMLSRTERRTLSRERVSTDEKAVCRWKAMLAAAPQAPPSEEGWRDIANAPRDGTWLLVTSPKYGMPSPTVQVATWDAERQGWRTTLGFLNAIWGPTHWRPLPAPPAPVLSDVGEGK